MNALVAVDVQRDFLPGGALAVGGGDQIIEGVKRLAATVRAGGGVVVATRDFHPADHLSFTENGGEWPAHCVVGTGGVAVHPSVLAHADYLVSKGKDAGVEEYSGFAAAAPLLEDVALSDGTVYVAGLALDYCVRATALDLVRAGYNVVLRADLTRAVDPSRFEEVVGELLTAGVRVEVA